MKSTAAAQQKLLELQTIDNEIGVLRHRRGALPENAAIASLTADRDEVRGSLARHLGAYEDAKAELTRLEGDSATVEARMARDNELLASGSNPAATKGIEAELESLRVRRSVLDEAQLIAMDVLEAAESELTTTRAAESELSAQILTVEASRDESLQVIAEHLSAEESKRGDIATLLDTDLVTLYDRVRTKSGIGAALFYAGACGACKIGSTGNELAAVRAAAIDEVLQCPECSAIMVRTNESGLWNTAEAVN